MIKESLILHQIQVFIQNWSGIISRVRLEFKWDSQKQDKLNFNPNFVVHVFSGYELGGWSEYLN